MLSVEKRRLHTRSIDRLSPSNKPCMRPAPRSSKLPSIYVHLIQLIHSPSGPKRATCRKRQNGVFKGENGGFVARVRGSKATSPSRLASPRRRGGRIWWPAGLTPPADNGTICCRGGGRVGAGARDGTYRMATDRKSAATCELLLLAGRRRRL